MSNSLKVVSTPSNAFAAFVCEVVGSFLINYTLFQTHQISPGTLISLVNQLIKLIQTPASDKKAGKATEPFDPWEETARGIGFAAMGQVLWNLGSSVHAAATHGLQTHLPAIFGSAVATTALPLLAPQVVDYLLSTQSLTEDQKAVLKPWLSTIARLALTAATPRISADENGVHYHHPSTQGGRHTFSRNGAQECVAGEIKIVSDQDGHEVSRTTRHYDESGRLASECSKFDCKNITITMPNQAGRPTPVQFSLSEGGNVTVNSSDAALANYWCNQFKAPKPLPFPLSWLPQAAAAEIPLPPAIPDRTLEFGEKGMSLRDTESTAVAASSSKKTAKTTTRRTFRPNAGARVAVALSTTAPTNGMFIAPRGTLSGSGQFAAPLTNESFILTNSSTLRRINATNTSAPELGQFVPVLNIQKAAVSPDRAIIAAVNGTNVAFFGSTTFTAVGSSMAMTNGDAKDVLFTNETTALVLDGANLVEIDIPTRTETRRIALGVVAGNTQALALSDTHIAVPARSQGTVIIDRATFVIVNTVPASGNTLGATFTPNGRLVIMDTDGLANVATSASALPTTLVLYESGTVTTIQRSPDGNFIFVGGTNGLMVFRPTATGLEKQAHILLGQTINGIAISPDRQSLLVTTDTNIQTLSLGYTLSSSLTELKVGVPISGVISDGIPEPHKIGNIYYINEFGERSALPAWLTVSKDVVSGQIQFFGTPTKEFSGKVLTLEIQIKTTAESFSDEFQYPRFALPINPSLTITATGLSGSISFTSPAAPTQVMSAGITYPPGSGSFVASQAIPGATVLANPITGKVTIFGTRAGIENALQTMRFNTTISGTFANVTIDDGINQPSTTAVALSNFPEDISPTLTILGNFTVHAGSSFNFNFGNAAAPAYSGQPTPALTFSLPNGDPLPAWIISDTGTLRGTAPNGNSVTKIKVTVSDGYRSTSQEVDFITSNTPPTAPSFPIPFNVTAEKDFTITPDLNGISDTDGDSTTVTMLDNPSTPWLKWNSATRTFFGNPPASALNQFVNATLMVSDGRGGTTDIPVQFVVTNQAPPIPTFGNTTAHPGRKMEIRIPTPVDPDGHTVTITITGVRDSNGPISTQPFTFEGGILSFTPPTTLVGQTITFVGAISDGVGSSTFQIPVAITNQAPVVPTLAPVTAPPLRPFTFGLLKSQFPDVDGDQVTLTVSAITLSNSTRVINTNQLTVVQSNDGWECTITPDVDMANHTVTVTFDVSDGMSGAPVKAAQVINVSPGYAPRKIGSLPDLSATTSNAVSFTINCLEIFPTRNNDDPVGTTFALTGLPSWLSFTLDRTAQRYAVSGTPSADNEGDVTLTLSATNGFGTTATEFNIKTTLFWRDWISKYGSYAGTGLGGVIAFVQFLRRRPIVLNAVSRPEIRDWNGTDTVTLNTPAGQFDTIRLVKLRDLYPLSKKLGFGEVADRRLKKLVAFLSLIDPGLGDWTETDIFHEQIPGIGNALPSWITRRGNILSITDQSNIENLGHLVYIQVLKGGRVVEQTKLNPDIIQMMSIPPHVTVSQMMLPANGGNDLNDPLLGGPPPLVAPHQGGIQFDQHL